MRRAVLGLGAVALMAAVRGAGADVVTLAPVAGGLSNPIFVTFAPGDNNHMYVAERAAGASGAAATTGEIRVIDLTTHQSSVFLDIPNINTTGEMGLLGMAFDPNYATNGKFYVNVSTAQTSGNFGVQNVIEYHATSATAASPTADGTLLQWAHTVSVSHKAGWIGFSPQVNPLSPGTTIRANDDHNLYIATGDGSFPGVDAGNNAQNTSTDLGKILRIHVDPATATYTIPASNPLAGSVTPGVKKEIFAYGLRNPFRDSFDKATGALYIADVGLDTREEIDVQTITSPTAPQNYEWPYREGTVQTPGSTGGPRTLLPNETEPIYDYGHSGAAKAVIGGYVYRGSAIPGLVGTYVFGDLNPVSGGTSFFETLKYNEATGAVSNVGGLTFKAGTPTMSGLVSFGEDNNGELYVVDQGGSSGNLSGGIGTVYKLVPVPEASTVGLLGLGAGLLLRRWRRR